MEAGQSRSFWRKQRKQFQGRCLDLLGANLEITFRIFSIKRIGSQICADFSVPRVTEVRLDSLPDRSVTLQRKLLEKNQGCWPVAGAEISQFVEKHCHSLSNYIIIIKGSLVVRKLPSYGRLSGSILTIMSTTSSCQPHHHHHHHHHHHQVVGKCNKSGTREFRLEKIPRRETLRFWCKVASVVACGRRSIGSLFPRLRASICKSCRQKVHRTVARGRFALENVKKCQCRSTFGRWGRRKEELDFRFKKSQKMSVSGRFWKMRLAICERDGSESAISHQNRKNCHAALLEDEVGRMCTRL